MENRRLIWFLYALLVLFFAVLMFLLWPENTNAIVEGSGVSTLFTP